MVLYALPVYLGRFVGRDGPRYVLKMGPFIISTFEYLLTLNILKIGSSFNRINLEYFFRYEKVRCQSMHSFSILYDRPLRFE